MPFDLRHAPASFQRCMISIFSNMIEQRIEVFMDNSFVFGSSFDDCLANLTRVLQRCREKNLTLSWEKRHFMVKKGIVSGHVISYDGIEVDRVKIDLIANISPPICVKDVRSFLGHIGFCRRFTQDFSKTAKP